MQSRIYSELLHVYRLSCRNGNLMVMVTDLAEPVLEESSHSVFDSKKLIFASKIGGYYKEHSAC